MNTDLTAEMTVLMTNENVCAENQIKINALLGNFLNNDIYMHELTHKLNELLNNREIDFFAEFPKIIMLIVELNKKVLFLSNEIEKELSKYVIYGLIYNYLDNYQSKLLNQLNQGSLRIAFSNICEVLMVKPKKVNIKKQSLTRMLLNCICNDDFIRI